MVAMTHLIVLEITIIVSQHIKINYCWVVNRFFPDDPFWDGQQCDNDEGTCCNGANTPLSAEMEKVAIV